MANLINLSKNSFLREHPFLDIVTDPTPEYQDHSYIFPGDEIVFWHYVEMPTDISPYVSLSDIVFKDAEVSVIAQRPNVFSEQFSSQFLSSRLFTLDKFDISFNNINAPVIPWGVAGADGYAPYLQVQSDRNFKLPSGDFRREVKFFTQHDNGTNTWKFIFYFPVLWRWEYWMQLIGATNDFFDPSLPQNGQNQWWYHYAIANGWKLKSRLRLNCVIQGVPTLIRSDLDLTPASPSDNVNDYNSNTDWINKSIKTAVIGGSTSNTPCLIKSNEDTEVFGYFEKVSAWDTNEQGALSAVVWIEPFEGAGVNARTRASSLYPITPESVFMGLSTSITDDDGIGIQTDTGEYIVTDLSGPGALVYFDALNPEKVIVYALIDHNKLSTIYAGINKFSLKVRLYNSLNELGSLPGRTRRGEEILQEATLITIPVSVTSCVAKKPNCPFNLTVFADPDDSDVMKNDKSDFYEFGDSLINSIIFTLQKSDSTCSASWSDVQDISDNSIGRFFPFGTNPDFYGANFVDDFGKKYTGVFIDWRKVYTAYGAGVYRMKITKTDVFANVKEYNDLGGLLSSGSGKIFCLRKYHCNLINGTVRIESLNQGLRGSLFDKNNLTDYAGGWNSQIRLKGVLKFKNSTYVKEVNQYGDTHHNAIRPYINEQQPKFTLSLKPIPGWMQWVVSTNILQSDEMLITDFNANNPHNNLLVSVPIMNDSDFSPSDINLQNDKSTVDISLAYGQNNLRKRNSLGY